MSRLRSGRAASSGRAARPAARGVFVQAPRSDVFVAMLGIALGAILLGCLLLALVLNRYEFRIKPAMRALPAAPTALAGLAGSEDFSSVRL